MISENLPQNLKLSMSSSSIFGKLEERNLKRIKQFSKRKNALSISQKKENNKNSGDVINVLNFVINKYNNEFKIENKIINNINTVKILNTSDNKIKNNNIDNIDNNYSNLSHNKEKAHINRKLNISNLEEINDNILQKIQNNNDKNEFALKYLSTKNKSFIKLGNNLIAKAKLQNDDFTESYILALGLNDNNIIRNKINNKYKNYENIEIIKEEKEKLINKNKNKCFKLLRINNKKRNIKSNSINIAKKIKGKKINLSLDKIRISNKSNNNCINNIKNSKKNLLIKKEKSFNSKNKAQKIIKLNIKNYNEKYAIKNIENRNFIKNKTNLLNKGINSYCYEYQKRNNIKNLQIIRNKLRKMNNYFNNNSFEKQKINKSFEIKNKNILSKNKTSKKQFVSDSKNKKINIKPIHLYIDIKSL